jgi:cholesterol transport system auxiliary component
VTPVRPEAPGRRAASPQSLAALAGAVALALALTGCAPSLRSSEQAATTYVLRPPAVEAEVPPGEAARRAARASIQVLRPLPHAGYASDRVLLRREDLSLGHYAAARWADNLPRVVEGLMVSTLRLSGALRAVQDDGGPFLPDYSLRLTIRRFDAEVGSDGVPRIRVAFDCVLGRQADRQVVAAFTAEGSAVAAEHRMSAVMPAFEQAAQQALASAAAQLIAAVGADAPR